MKNRSDKFIKFRAMLIISLFLMVLFVTGFGISCQYQASAPPAASPGLPRAPTEGTPPAALPTIEVVIEGFVFKPAEITIPVGNTIVWHNKDSVTHTVTAQDKTFDSGSLVGGDTFSYTFEQHGTFEYYCRIHSSMKGKAVVE